MSQTKLSTSNKDVLSRALGAAFLSHQVEQLERSARVGSEISGTRRDTKVTGANYQSISGNKNAVNSATPKVTARSKVEFNSTSVPQDDSRTRETERLSDEEVSGSKKDADIVVVDASVLVHALDQLKKWCRSKREEIVVVPLEALNTIDLLKKGNSLLAQRARAASRILEQQVGVNDRIRVQRDDAFVLWDDVPFDNGNPSQEVKTEVQSISATPEWLRRTLCCARWEQVQEQGKPEIENVEAVPSAARDDPEDNNVSGRHLTPSVLLAVCQAPSGPDSTSPEPGAVSSSPVPLPAPHLYAQKNEQRASGHLVRLWALRAGINVMDVTPSALHSPQPSRTSRPNEVPAESRGGRGRSNPTGYRRGHFRGSSDEDRSLMKTNNNGQGPRNKITDRSANNAFSNSAHIRGHTTGRIPEKMVERPAATMAMNASCMSQPARVVRVLARGEKLDP